MCMSKELFCLVIMLAYKGSQIEDTMIMSSDVLQKYASRYLHRSDGEVNGSIDAGPLEERR
jgi:hypothetical protein